MIKDSLLITSKEPVLRKVLDGVLFAMIHKNYLDGHRLTSREEVEHELVSDIASKSKEFYKRENYKLVDR